MVETLGLCLVDPNKENRKLLDLRPKPPKLGFFVRHVSPCRNGDLVSNTDQSRTSPATSSLSDRE